MGIVAIAISTPRASESLRANGFLQDQNARGSASEKVQESEKSTRRDATAAGTPEFRNRIGVQGLDSFARHASDV